MRAFSEPADVAKATGVLIAVSRSVVLSGGNVEPGDPIEVELPTSLHQRLGVV